MLRVFCAFHLMQIRNSWRWCCCL